MAKIVPFCAVRPRPDLASQIAALPYDVYSREEAYEKVKNDSYSFLRIDRPETQFPKEQDMYAPEVYEKAKELLEGMLTDGELVQEKKPAYYVYQLIMDGRSQIGIAACASVDDYENQTIKRHENTREEKEQDRIRHIDVCSAQTGPIFLAYRGREGIESEIKKAMTKPPVYDFTAEDGITHRMWIIDDDEAINHIRREFEQVEAVYIADGHHRCASAVKVSQKRREQKKGCDGTEEFNFFLSVLFPEDQLMILDYNRVLKSLNGLTTEEFRKKTAERFMVEEKGEEPYRPLRKGTIGMYLEGKWYCLTIPASCYSDDPVESLDVAVLQRELLQPILGIADPKVDERIDFVGGIRGLKELEHRVNTDAKVAFAMYPTEIRELFAVSDAGKLMPPKSTWFEPKLRSGLLIHLI